MQYPKTVKAAKAVSTDEKAMAAAIFDEIPPRGQGRTPAGSPTVETALMDLSTELRSSGFDYSAATLKEYREVAAWAARGNDRQQPGISWLSVSWSVHREAFKGGMTWKTFVKHVEAKEIKVVDDLRRLLNKRPTRLNRPSEKLKEIKDLIGSGQLAPDDLNDLASALPAPAIDAARRQHARNHARDHQDAQHDDDTPEQIEEFESQVDAVRQGVRSIQSLIDGMTEQFGDSVHIKYLKDSLRALSMAITIGRKRGLHSEDDAQARALLADIRLVADQNEMLLDGVAPTFSADDLDFMEANGLVG